MSKPAKPAATGDQPPKSKKMLIIIIAAVVLLAGGGGAAFVLLKKPAHPPAKQEHSAEADDAAAAEEDNVDEEDSHEKTPPKYVELGTFTGKLVDESADRYLQIAISVKLSKPALEEKIKERNPEIMHKINMLLQSKRPAELDTVQGKEKLANDIKAQVEYVLGLRRTAPEIHTTPLPDAADANDHNSHEEPSHKEEARSKRGVEEILFTSLIIQ